MDKQIDGGVKGYGRYSSNSSSSSGGDDSIWSKVVMM